MTPQIGIVSGRRKAASVAALAAALGLALAAGTGAHSAPPIARQGEAARPPQRIVSLNLCADQFLIALADRHQIAGLTHYAADPVTSAAAAQAKTYPILGQSAEEVLAIQPDLLVGMPARRSAVMAALQGRGYRALDVKRAESFAAIVRETRKVAGAVGHPERGERLIADMERQLAALPKPGRGRVAAYYQRRGYLTGTGTLVDDLMQRAGLVNLAGKLGKPALSTLSLEEMVAARPDFIIVESQSDTVADQGTAMLHHPALRDIPRIRLPQAWTVCGGPAYVAAARSLVRQVAAH
ncbi:ABC transporter substrate-binding protein [Caenibius sp. WL]|uniref:ABC transporter substrate-binding protein n=1 Tax=Caenibius sp. WL TaxID=2872646 RepID=UPI001C997A00|nr:ABC transporter substrate-binding protein [Caenibius sp. WL]QZP09257.1 ABC transporter substrate-binding protein [Caenibius sp. WL]